MPKRLSRGRKNMAKLKKVQRAKKREEARKLTRQIFVALTRRRETRDMVKVIKAFLK